MSERQTLIDHIERRMLKGWRSVKFAGAELDVILSALRASPSPPFSSSPPSAGEEEIARVICRAYCGLHKQPPWGQLSVQQQDAEVDCQWDLWRVEARAVLSLLKGGSNE